MPEFQEQSKVVRKETIAENVFRLTLNAPAIAGSAHPGQFVMVAVDNGFDPLLRRPFSLHQVASDGTVQLVFKIVGKGTARLARYSSGDILDCIGPLGRGYDLDSQGRAALVGGGMGIAPLYFLAKRLAARAGERVTGDVVILGAAKRAELALFAEEFSALGYRVKTATDDGSMGHHGFVTDLLQTELNDLQQVYSCGPYPMMRIVADQARAARVGCQVSLETHMACGLGACLGCTLPGRDGHYIHVCRQGPVFDAQEVSWTL